MQKYAESFFCKFFTWFSNCTVYSKLCVIPIVIYLKHVMYNIPLFSSVKATNSSWRWLCALHHLQSIFRTTVQKQKKYNVFKQLREKGIKFMSFSPAPPKMVYDKKENHIFLCFLSGFNSFGRHSWNGEKWFWFFLLLIWIKNQLTAFFFLLVCKILLFYDQ